MIFSIKNGVLSYKTFPGAICSFLIYVLIMIYGSKKLLIMINREDTKQTVSIQKNLFPNDEYFTANELGFDFIFWVIHRESTSFDFLATEEVQKYIDILLIQEGNQLDI